MDTNVDVGTCSDRKQEEGSHVVSLQRRRKEAREEVNVPL